MENRIPVSELETVKSANTPITEALAGMIVSTLREDSEWAYTRAGLVERVQEQLGIREVAAVANLLRLVSGDAREFVSASAQEFNRALEVLVENGALCGRLHEGEMYFWSGRRRRAITR